MIKPKNEITIKPRKLECDSFGRTFYYFHLINLKFFIQKPLLNLHYYLTMNDFLNLIIMKEQSFSSILLTILVETSLRTPYIPTS